MQQPVASVVRVARDNNIDANQVWAWRKVYAQGLLVEDAQAEIMLPSLPMGCPIVRVCVAFVLISPLMPSTRSADVGAQYCR